MLVNGLKSNGKTFEAEVCVVGSGAAGITLACDLADRGISVLLIESGGLQFKWWSHNLLDIDLAGIATERFVKGTRERYFGGTTNHWGGVIRPLDAWEFQEHSWVPNSGWPITRQDLEPYYRAAQKLLNLPELTRDFAAEARKVPGGGRSLVGDSGDLFEPVIWRRVGSERLMFGPWRLPEIRKDKRITCVINTTIAEIHPNSDGSRVNYMEGRTQNGGTLNFRAKQFVLCTGAIENARLLLASNSVVPGGLGNEHDVVGRYFMDHPGDSLGRWVPMQGENVRSIEERLSDTELVGWTTTEELKRSEKLLGFQTFLSNADSTVVLPHELAARALAGAARPGPGTGRRLMLFNWEQSPNPESRVMLSDNRDTLGIPRPLLHYAVADQDVSSARRSVELFAHASAQAGIGRMYVENMTTIPPKTNGGHHIGTTRMSNDPRNGVTDKHGRVHSIDNLYAGGSSLFPTGGWQHPTFTIVAMALRQGEHLATRLQKTG